MKRTEQQIMQAWPQGQEPLLSITCPAYNQVDYIEQTLDSFLAQRTTFAFEILINDDASSDGTTQVIERYAEQYPNLIKPVIHQHNQYQLGRWCFPALFNRARGKYIAYCEGDDYWIDPLKLQKQVNFLEANADYVLTYHDAMAFDSEGERGIQLTGQYQADASAMDLLKARPISTLTTCFRNVLHELPRELAQAPVLDLCWWSMLGAHGKGKYLADIAPARYRLHPGGIFSQRPGQNKLQMTLHTYACLANYYFRQGDRVLYEHFLVQVSGMCVAAIRPVQKFRALLHVSGNVSRNLIRRLTPAAARG